MGKLSIAKKQNFVYTKHLSNLLISCNKREVIPSTTCHRLETVY